jgi:hypothetical protein
MNDSKLQILIQEVLSRSRTFDFSPPSSFVVNEAARDLRRMGEEALSDIEDAIRACVLATSEDRNQLFARYLGILDLWMAYFSISGQRHVDRAVTFLRSLSGPVVTVSIQALGVTLRNTTNLGPEIPAALRHFLAEAAEGSTGETSIAAKRLLAKHSASTK